MPARTIDNLGPDASIRYANDQAILDKSFGKEAIGIPTQTEIDVSAPFFPGEIEAALHLQPTGITWALFIPPNQYFEQRRRLFSFQLIPSMGSDDRQESQAQKILAKLTMEELKTKADIGNKDPRELYEENIILEEEAKEKKILTSLLNTIATFDKLIIEINSRRNQYQKG